MPHLLKLKFLGKGLIYYFILDRFHPIFQSFFLPSAKQPLKLFVFSSFETIFQFNRNIFSLHCFFVKVTRHHNKFFGYHSITDS